MDPLHDCLYAVKRELDYLRWFYHRYVPKMETAVKEEYRELTGKEVPEGY